MKHIEIKTIGELQEITFTQGNITVVCLNFGARLYKIFTPDRTGNSANILLSHDSYCDIINDQACFGATIDPVAGRIVNTEWNHSTFQKIGLSRCFTAVIMAGSISTGRHAS